MKKTIIKNANVISEDKILKNHTVIIENSLIKEITSRFPKIHRDAECEIIDARG
jgi:N-acetylglucosamine-6-phosphate deacetylase